MRQNAFTTKSRFICYGLIPVLMVLFSLVQEGIAFAQKVATLEKIQGNVRVFASGSNRGKKGRAGMALFVNSRVKTMDSNSMADIVYLKGGIVRVMPETEVTLEKADFAENKVNAKLQLAAGKIFNVVNKLSNGSSYEVSAMTATAGVKGTIFSAESNGSQAVFMVKEGKVEVDGEQSPVLVSDLKKSVVKANQAPEPPVDLSPEEIAMFDILNDLFEEIKSDIKEDVQESLKEDIINDAIERDMEMDMHDMH